MGDPVSAAVAAAAKIFTAATIKKIAINIAIQTSLSIISKKLAGDVDKGNQNAGIGPQQVTTTGSATPRALVYGTATKAGSVFFNGVDGAANSDLWELHAFADHEIEQYVTLYMEGYRPINLATDLDGNGFCTLPEFTNADGDKMLQLFLYTGTDDQLACADVVNVFDEWTDDHRARGTAYIAFRFITDRSPGSGDPDADIKNVWDHGKPNNIKVKMRGKKLYDPRQPGQLINDKSTWTWTDNAALCMADYLRSDPVPVLTNTFGEDPARIDYATVAAAADICDQPVTVPDGLGGTTTQKRYTVDGAITLDTQHAGIYEALRQALNGDAVYTGGIWSVFSYTDQTPITTIDGDWLAGAITVQAGVSRNNRINTVKGLYASDAARGALIEFQSREDAALVAKDGQSISDEIQLPLISDEYRAQRLAILHKRAKRVDKVVQGTFNLRALQLAVADVVTIDIPELEVSGDFTVDEWRLTNLAGEPGSAPVIEMTLRAIYATDIDISEITPVIIPDSLDTALWGPSPATGLVAVGTVNAIKLDWSNPPQTEIERVDVYASATNDRGAATKIAQTTAEEYIDVVGQDITRFYWVKVFGRNGISSEWEPAGVTSGVSATSTAITGGIDAVAVFLKTDRYQFTYDTDGTTETANPASQVATLTVERENISTAPVWSTSPSVTLGGAAGATTRTLSEADFGANIEVLVTVTVGAYSDSQLLVRTVNGEPGEDAPPATLPPGSPLALPVSGSAAGTTITDLAATDSVKVETTGYLELSLLNGEDVTNATYSVFLERRQGTGAWSAVDNIQMVTGYTNTGNGDRFDNFQGAVFNVTQSPGAGDWEYRMRPTLTVNPNVVLAVNGSIILTPLQG